MSGAAATMAPPAGAPAARAPAAAQDAKWTVLCVDDEPNILSSLKRTLHGAGYRVLTADGGAQALALLEAYTPGHGHPIDVVVSDMRMPEMDGAQLLERIHAGWPKLVRVLLTGQSDIESAISAINRGRILRYLRKPWNNDELLATIREGVERLALERERARLELLTKKQNLELADLNADLDSRVRKRTAELQHANRRLQENHLQSIKVFSTLIELRGDQLSGHSRRVADLAHEIAVELGLPDEQAQLVMTAGLMHDVGLIGARDRLMSKPVSRYSDDELALYRGHVTVAEQSLLALEDMHPLLPFVRGHHERWDGAGFPDKLAGTAIPLGARILAVADAYDDLQNGHLVDSKLAATGRSYTPISGASACMSAAEARALMARERGSKFCPQVLDAFMAITGGTRQTQRQDQKAAGRPISSAVLEAGMVLAQDLVSSVGVPMLLAGHKFTEALIQRVREFEQREGGSLRIHVQPKADA